MPRTRTYTTDHGTATATYDGSSWHVEAEPSNASTTNDRVAFEAWPDEAGFRGRQWRTGANTPDLLGSHNPIGMDDQWPSLRAIAEAAIEVAFDRVDLQRRPCYCNDHFTEHTVAEHQRLATEEAPVSTVTFPTTSISPDEARMLLTTGLPEGFSVLQGTSIADAEGTVLDEVDDDQQQWLLAETLDGDPAPIVAALREQAEVDRLVADGYTVGEAEAIVEHDAGDHDEESDPGCPRCADTHDPEDSPLVDRESLRIDLTPGNAEQANILTMLSQQFARQGMVPNAFGAMASVLDLARCLQANDPERLARVIESLRRDDANWGPDTPAGKAAARRRQAEEDAYMGVDDEE